MSEQKAKSKKIIIGVICGVVAVALVVAILGISGVFTKEPEDGTTTEGTTTEGTTNTNGSKYDPTKYEVQGVDDKSYLVVLGEDGKAVINDKNQIQVVERDNKGEIIKDENGEPQTHWEQIDTKYVTKDTIYTAEYTINIVEGWEGFGSGYIVKEGAKVGSCLMKCNYITGDNYDSMTLNEYLTQLNVRREKAKANYEKNGFKVSYEEKEITITDKNIKAIYCKEIIHNKNGALTNYAEILYFELDGNKKYRFEYACADDENYNANKDFDFVDYVNNNLIIK